MIKENYIIFTGGPGSGKSSVLNEISDRCHTVVQEVGRQIISEQVRMGGHALPWGDKQAYSRLMLERSIRDYQLCLNSDTLYFFDRGIPDTYGYEKLEKIPHDKSLPDILRDYRYNRNVFIFPPWEEIYGNDTERKQDFTLAVETFDVMSDIYSEIGYDLITVPQMTVKERADFIIDQVQHII